LKLLFVPALIGAITLAGRRWGPAVAGWLSGFPIVAGPILFFVALEQGPQFASASAVGALAGGLAWMAFAVCYAWAALGLPWGLALFVSLLGYFAAGFALISAALPFAAIIVMIVIAVVLVPRTFPRLNQPIGASKFSRLELVARMVAGGVLTVTVTQFSSLLGPRFSGLFAVFPVMGIVLAAFSHRASGNVFTIHLLRGMVSGFYAFTAFCLTIALGVPRIGIPAAFLLALAFSLTVHFGVLWMVRRPGRRRAAGV